MGTSPMGVGNPPKKRILADHFRHRELLDSWDWAEDIGNGDFGELLTVVAKDIHEKPKAWLVLAAVNYDTPFFNGYGLYSGTGCLNGKCYDRSELNYIAQGALWAAVGVSKEAGHEIVEAWKRKGCIPGTDACLNPAAVNQPTQETLEMFDLGFDFYNQLYPPAPRPLVDSVPQPMWP